jgi:hypothetical protein
VRANAQKDIYVGMILILIFAEALGLYGLIVAIILSSNATGWTTKTHRKNKKVCNNIIYDGKTITGSIRTLWEELSEVE